MNDPSPAPKKCHAAVLTPRGRGAVASVVICGPDAGRVVERLFRAASGRPLHDCPLGRVVFGQWVAATPRRTTHNRHSEQDQRLGEELVVCRRHDDQVEVHCHGGSVAVETILSSLAAEGCFEIDPGDWTVAQEPDKLVAEARVALSRTRTIRSATVLLDQYRGALSRAVMRVIQCIGTQETCAAKSLLAELVQSARFGQRLITAWQLVMAGRTNVGKSSLVNALLGYQRSLVYHEAGTTRDLLTAATAVDGWPVDLTDTAGSQIAGNELEAEGMARTARSLETADLVLLVSDVSQAWDEDDERLLEAAKEKVVLVHNKSDLVASVPKDRPHGVLTSARTGDGIPHLVNAISYRLVPTPPPPSTAIPFQDLHQQRLSHAAQALAKGDDALAVGTLQELLGTNHQVEDRG